jgi:hypothetical protein
LVKERSPVQSWSSAPELNQSLVTHFSVPASKGACVANEPINKTGFYHVQQSHEAGTSGGSSYHSGAPDGRARSCRLQGLLGSTGRHRRRFDGDHHHANLIEFLGGGWCQRTLTATVTPTAATGTVTFYAGSTTLGTGALSSGTATFTATFSAAGTESLTAT